MPVQQPVRRSKLTLACSSVPSARVAYTSHVTASDPETWMVSQPVPPSYPPYIVKPPSVCPSPVEQGVVTTTETSGEERPGGTSTMATPGAGQLQPSSAFLHPPCTSPNKRPRADSQPGTNQDFQGGSVTFPMVPPLVRSPSNKPLQRSPLNGKAFDGQTMVVEGSSEVRHRRAEW